MNELVFSYAENAQGQLVHVDSVPRGKMCGCICPHCKETLESRQGEERAHGFAHKSNTRGANLRICYMVSAYKLAEQIIQTKKKIRVPDYYGIFKSSIYEFSSVEIDSNFDRNDKQPDVIATTKDGHKILIEFTFKYKVLRKNVEDYKNYTCLEIDLSGIKLEDLEDFLLNSDKNRTWVQNQELFEEIEPRYKNENKNIRLTKIEECQKCDLKDSCCAVKFKDSRQIIEIENGGFKYRICKPDEFNRIIEETARIRRTQEECEKRRIRELELADQKRRKRQQEEYEIRKKWEIEIAERERIKREQEQKELEENKVRDIDTGLFSQPTVWIDRVDRTCFMCVRNLDYMCDNSGFARCGAYPSLKVPKATPPDTAKSCRGFKAKSNSK